MINKLKRGRDNMTRQFYINMTQKGRFQDRYKTFIDLNYITFIKTDKKQIEIVKIDFKEINNYYKDEVNKSNCKGFLTHYNDGIYLILGINKNNVYKLINEAKEIKENDIKGYIQISLEAIEKETEKALLILNSWIAKSQTIKEDNRLYIKDWLFFKEYN